jgi:hypothetical protein
VGGRNNRQDQSPGGSFCGYQTNIVSNRTGFVLPKKVGDFGEGGIAMANERINDLSAFKGCIGERLADGGSNLTLDEALVNWELENQTDAERGETLQAIRLGLDDM